MMKTLLRLSAFFLVAASLAACQSMSQLQPPTVRLDGIQPQKIGLFNQQWQVTLAVSNPNDRDLVATSVDYTLYVQGEKFADGMTQSAVTLPARASTQVTTQLTTGLLDVLKQLQPLAGEAEPKVDYRIKGVANVKGLLLPVHFDREGTVALPSLNQSGTH